LTPNAPKDKLDPDYYVSFMVPFQSVVSFLANESIAITDQTPMRYISATATQTSSLNQDLGGIDDKNYNPSDPWNFSDPKPLVVPEPSSGILALGSLAAALFIRRRR
jgi:MYXO-CTERM domain-containing protein